MAKLKPSSKELLKAVLEPHTELALALLKMVMSLDSSDPSSRFQIASIIIFLAGIDKTLSLGFDLLYLAGKVNWKWMILNTKSKPPVGFIECQRGVTSKIMKLKELGVDITYMQEIINLRNEYIHSNHIYVGYTEGIDEVEHKTRLNQSGPIISYPLAPITAFKAEDIYYCAEHLVEEISSFIDKTGWQKEWFRLAAKAKELPKNPEPEYTQFLNEPEKELETLEALNIRFVGDGAKLLQG